MKLNKDITLVEFTPIKANKTAQLSSLSNVVATPSNITTTAGSGSIASGSNVAIQNIQNSNQQQANQAGYMQGLQTNQITGGTVGSTLNIQWPYYAGYQYYNNYSYPYIQYHYFYPQYKETPMYELQTKKVENGFIVLKGGKEYVFSNTKSLAKFITESYKPKKEEKKKSS